MKILSIETSCDETGISILEHTSGVEITLLGNALASQIELHAQYGGVFPAMAKRAHAEKITLLVQTALDEAYMLDAVETEQSVPDLSFLDDKETTLKEHLAPFLAFYQKPDIDYIAVTVGPGLEPALWVGINTARALSVAWDTPIIPINHMEGHIVTAAVEKIVDTQYQFADLQFPLLSLLVSGGHTELVIARAFGEYEKIGQTRDDAVGEAFDKVARMLGLPYPGGPAVSKLAAQFREKNSDNPFTLPRPMLHSGDYDFSFSGIKTATLYAIRDLGRNLADDDKMALAAAFEDAVVEVLIKKTIDAATEHNTPTVIVGGGVAGNTYLRTELAKAVAKKLPDTIVLFPEQWLATDNAVMIGLAAMLQIISGQIKTASSDELKADGNLSIDNS
ncbi:MAG: tRNA (adenosine(37)-N6)-threonylcarbamoyltransferase complex transferase subunit TsaD [Candidatus Pacebacteria bacterium]|nr:tRNA (adenosine(37)-N6)-threonylcarbamoyltransferase complex transferase subunit TsaD [Candidatus Paceibacterota bacterium]